MVFVVWTYMQIIIDFIPYTNQHTPRQHGPLLLTLFIVWTYIQITTDLTPPTHTHKHTPRHHGRIPLIVFHCVNLHPNHYRPHTYHTHQHTPRQHGPLPLTLFNVWTYIQITLDLTPNTHTPTHTPASLSAPTDTFHSVNLHPNHYRPHPSPTHKHTPWQHGPLPLTLFNVWTYIKIIIDLTPHTPLLVKRVNWGYLYTPIQTGTFECGYTPAYMYTYEKCVTMQLGMCVL